MNAYSYTHTWTTVHTEESCCQLMLCVHSQRVVLTVVDIRWGAAIRTHITITEGAASLHTEHREQTQAHLVNKESSVSGG